MTSRSHALRTFAAGLGIAALAAMGALSVAPAANAASPSDIQGTTGSLTIHKHAGSPGSAGNGTELDASHEAALGQALDGVEFSIERVNVNGAPIDLTTSTGWDQAKGTTPTSVSTAPYSLGAATTVTTANGGVATAANLPYGLYLVTETSPGPHPIVSPVQPFLVSVPYPDQGNWTYDVHVYPKNKLNETDPTKTVAAPDALALGSKITWTVTSPIAPLAAGDTYRSFSITDNLDSRLTYNGVVVKLDGAILVEGTDYTVSGNTVITFTSTGLGKLTGSSTVTADYVTTVSSLGADGEITNTAVVNTNGSDRTTGTVQTNWGPLEIVKKDANTGNTLAGAIFEVYDAKNGTKVVGPFTTSDTGQILVDGLWVGNDATLSKEYWIKEVQAPAGYVLPADPWTSVTVQANGTGKPKILDIDNTQQVGPILPLTGGGGTIAFTLVGAALVLAGAGAIVLRRIRTRR